MTTSQPVPWKHICLTLLRFAPFWLGVTILFGGLGVTQALFKQETWEASQPLIVRDEANGSVDRLGKFSSQTELIAAQETLVEMARNREVVEAALQRLGPPEGETSENWPSSQAVDFVASECVNLRAPKTSEFGKTEVVYLTTKDQDPDRARLLCEAVFTALTEHLRKVRQLRANSVVSELRQARDLAKQNLDNAIQELRAIEEGLGMDLGELRGLSESINAESSSSRVLTELQRDLRQAEIELKKLESLRDLLVRAYEDPGQLALSDGDLLTTQPTLQRLTAGLIDAQLESSKLAGRLTPEHPKLQSAHITTQTIREELRREIANVSLSMQPALQLARDKVQRLVDKQDNLQEKLTRLASIRTEYSRLVDEVENRTTLLSQAETTLSEAEATLTAAMTTNLISPLGPARVGDKPVGISGMVIVAGATVAGLMLGLGGVFLVAPSPSGTTFGRRWSDTLGGRRATDSNTDTNRSTGVPPGAVDRRGASVNRERRAAFTAQAPVPQVENRVLPLQHPVTAAEQPPSVNETPPSAAEESCSSISEEPRLEPIPFLPSPNRIEPQGVVSENLAPQVINELQPERCQAVPPTPQPTTVDAFHSPRFKSRRTVEPSAEVPDSQWDEQASMPLPTTGSLTGNGTGHPEKCDSSSRPIDTSVGKTDDTSTPDDNGVDGVDQEIALDNTVLLTHLEKIGAIMNQPLPLEDVPREPFTSRNASS